LSLFQKRCGFTPSTAVANQSDAITLKTVYQTLVFETGGEVREKPAEPLAGEDNGLGSRWA
jgi:hypothetical protein